MGESKLDLLQGTLDLMVLQTLAAMGSLHGYGIARRIEQVSGNEVLLNQGTIYASLVRLEQRGWIAAELGRLRTTIARPSSTPSPRPAVASSPKTPLLARLTGVMDRVLSMDREERGAAMSAPAPRVRPRRAFFLASPPLDADLEAELAAHIDFAIEEEHRARPDSRRSPPPGAHPLRRHGAGERPTTRSARTYETRHSSAGSEVHLPHPRPRPWLYHRRHSSSSPSASAPTSPSSAWSTSCCCARCPSPSPQQARLDRPAAHQVRPLLRHLFHRRLR